MVPETTISTLREVNGNSEVWGKNFEKENMMVNWHFQWGVWRKGFAPNQGLYSFN